MNKTDPHLKGQSHKITVFGFYDSLYSCNKYVPRMTFRIQESISGLWCFTRQQYLLQQETQVQMTRSSTRRHQLKMLLLTDCRNNYILNAMLTCILTSETFVVTWEWHRSGNIVDYTLLKTSIAGNKNQIFAWFKVLSFPQGN